MKHGYTKKETILVVWVLGDGCSSSLMMIRLALQNGAGAVDLLGEYQAHHLVTEGHRREGYLLVGALVEGRGEAVGTTDDEYQPPGCLLFLL